MVITNVIEFAKTVMTNLIFLEVTNNFFAILVLRIKYEVRKNKIELKLLFAQRTSTNHKK